MTQGPRIVNTHFTEPVKSLSRAIWLRPTAVGNAHICSPETQKLDISLLEFLFSGIREQQELPKKGNKCYKFPDSTHSNE